MQNNYKQLLKKLMRYSVLGIVIQCFVFAPFFRFRSGAAAGGYHNG